LEIALKLLTAIADIFTIIAAGIAIYLFIYKREAIYSAFRVLINFSFQITLVELKAKLERLNDLSAEDSDEISDIINILNDIAGQIRGSKVLSKQFNELLAKIESISEDKRKLTEPRKRALVSELRERLRNIDVENYSDMIGE
jgi:hypothetical protein